MTPDTAPKFAVRKYADVSTGHITERDNQLLTEHNGETGLLMVSPFEYGWFIRLGDKEDYTEEEHQKIVTEYGFSEAFWNLLILTVDEDFQGIVLDRDAAFYHELPQFDW